MKALIYVPLGMLTSLPCMSRKSGAAGQRTNEVVTIAPVIAPVCPPKSAQIEAMLQKFEKGNATASEIEEFRQLAGEVLRNWQPRYSVGFKKRIESAMSLLDPTTGENSERK
jgi:hypothetical protein